MTNKFYVYAHCKGTSSLDSDIFYIGKGSGKRAYVKNQRSKFWNSIVNKYNYTIKILHENLSEEDAFATEKILVAIYKGFGYKLTNLTEGGDNPPSQLGKLRSEKTKKALSESHKGQITWMKGKIHSPESRKKLSESHKGNKPSEETRKRLSEAGKGHVGWWTGKKQSQETIRKRQETKAENRKLKELG